MMNPPIKQMIERANIMGVSKEDGSIFKDEAITNPRIMREMIA